MTAVARTRFLSVFALLVVAAPIVADPLGDLLPPVARQLEKRTFSAGGNDYEMRYYRGSNQGRSGAAFSPDGKHLALSSASGGLNVFDVTSGRSLGTVGSYEQRSEGLTVAFSPDSKHLLTASWAGRYRGEYCPVILWDAQKRAKIRSLDEDTNDTAFVAAAFSPDGKTVALAGAGNRRGVVAATLHLWDVATGDEIRRLDNILPNDPGRRTPAMIQSVAYSPDGRTLAVLGDTRLVLLETATLKVRTHFAVQPPPDARQDIYGNGYLTTAGAVAFSPDGRTLAVGCSDGTVRRYEMHNGRELPPLTGHVGGVLALFFTPDGKLLHTFGADQKLFVWSADTNRDWRPKSTPPSEVALEQLWNTLRTDDPLDLYGSSQVLQASPGPTVAFLRKHLTPAAKGDTERIERLVADVQKPDYNDRKKAVIALRKIGAAAVPAIRQASERSGDDLLRRLLFEFESHAPPRDQIRAVRALGVLEQMGTDEARLLLEELSKGAPEAPFTQAAKAAFERTKGVKPGTVVRLEALWDDLGSDDSATAFRAARQLVARAETSVPLLRDRLRELAKGDVFDNEPKRVAKMIADLDSEEFETRDTASKGLRTLGKLVQPDLKKVLEGKPSAELKRQVEDILSEIGHQSQSAELLRVGRALEVLEWIRNDQSRQALAEIGKEAHGVWLREATTDSLRRSN